MNEPQAQIMLCHFEHEPLTLEALAARAGVHPTLIEHWVEYGLLEPMERNSAPPRFAVTSVTRVRTIERLRHDLGANLAGVATILDLLDRLSGMQRELKLLRRRG